MINLRKDLFILPTVGLLALLGQACSTTRGPALQPDWSRLQEGQQGSREAAGDEEPGDEGSRDGVSGKSSISSSGEMTVLGVKLQNTDFDYPVSLNSRVEFWVTYFTGRGRPHFEKYLERSEFFIPYIRPILKQAGLPEDLVYLAMIESGFNNHAKSHAKAVGPWQFISATGKRYGLMVNWWVDERRDTRKSTLAAVEYLRELYSMFQSWELAAAAYNAGESKIARGIRRYGTRDFWALTRHRFLRQETRDYVPKIIAAAIVSKNRTQFGFPAPRGEGHDGEARAGDGEWVKLEPPQPGIDEQQSIQFGGIRSVNPPILSNLGRLVRRHDDGTRFAHKGHALPIDHSTLFVQLKATVAGQQHPGSVGHREKAATL